LRIEKNNSEFFWEGATDGFLETILVEPIISLVNLISFIFLITRSNGQMLVDFFVQVYYNNKEYWIGSIISGSATGWLNLSYLKIIRDN